MGPGGGGFVERGGIRGRGRCVGGDVFGFVEQDGAADAVVATARSRVQDEVFVAIAKVTACASFAREGNVPFNVLLRYRQRA